MIADNSFPASAGAARVGALGRSAPRARRLPLVPLLVVSAIFIPEAFGFLLGGFRLTGARLILLGLAPVMLLGFPRLVASPRYSFVLSDAIMPLLGFWMVLAPAQIDGLAVALKSGGVDALDFVGPYLLIRCTLRDAEDVHRAVRLFCILAAIAGVLAIADTVTDSAFWRIRLAQWTGYTYFHFTGEPAGISPAWYRLGLHRAMSLFEHPIMLGIVMSYALLLSRDIAGWTRWWCRAGCGIGLVLSLSAAPWDLFAVGLALTLYTRLLRVPGRWLVLVVIAVFVVSTIFLLSRNPLGWIFNHLTFDAQTGYFRLLIWQYAGHDVLTSPIFGVGIGDNWFRPAWMPSSVDSLWLRAAMEFGIPGSLLLALSLLGAASRPVRLGWNRAIGERDLRLHETLGIILFLSFLIGFANDLWGATEITVAVIMGMRAAFAQFRAEPAGRAI